MMDRKEISRRLLDFTLEIISLLSGEDYTIVNKTSEETPIIHESGGWTPITEPPPLIHEQKILELTHKMMELLTGEVPVRCHDVAVYFSMEEWEYIEGHKDLYKEAMMEDSRPLTSQDGSKRRNSPERCPRCLYSKEEQLPENHQMTNKGKDAPIIKVEDEEERMMGDPPCNSWVDEDIPVHVTTGSSSNNSEGTIVLSRVQNEAIMQPSGENLITLVFYPGLLVRDQPPNPPNRERPSPNQSQIITRNPGLLCNPSNHDGSNTGPDSSCNPPDHEEPSPDQSQIATTSTAKSGRVKKNDSGGNPHTCSICGRSFTCKSRLLTHQKVHTGEKPYSCSFCAKCFTCKSGLVIHERIHKGEKPFSCPECGKCFTNKSDCTKHQKRHTGEKPYPCSECGKCFISKGKLREHQRIHTGVRPYSCSVCGKRFMEKSLLVKHDRTHTSDKPFSCSTCGRSFPCNVSLVKHQTIHMT
ncbi:oocyte zinc finger protein XlCOF7.1-like isoform X1 [Bufo gargarizans]|uniref:oocyte zinc finger protein XlCOF7.1-like isoform X1 n=1 Tax=Bufo gargarizans TaxID=30331 RepID=UPI001CF1558A|nr:oocyte zinc finger protein XlCOF7.1-like isoform X1 [Bufo gargarizans]